MFFKTYTEKVWGMSCKDISADWAAQRIKGLSLWSAIFSAFKLKKSSDTIKTLINSFLYPRKGPGMMWEACTEKIKNLGGNVVMGANVKNISFSEQDKKWLVSYIHCHPMSMLHHLQQPMIHHMNHQQNRQYLHLHLKLHLSEW